MQPHLDALIERGELRKLELEDGKAPVFVARRTRLEVEPRDVAVLLSPFDNLLWDRNFAVRLFRFEHLIEVYKPQPQRQFGYYVLPLLVGDELVGRADIKSERARSTLQIKAFHREAHVRRSARLDDRLDEAAARLASDIGLERVLRR